MASMDVDVDVNFLDAQSWDPKAMPERLHWLRHNDPIHWSEKTGLWVMTKFEDVSFVSKNQEIFTSARGVRPDNPAKLGLLDEDEPRHGALRGMINRGFSPRRVKKLEIAFRGITRRALDAVAHKGECDFVDDIAVPLPILLIAEMLGIRKEDHDQFHQWSDDLIAADGNLDNPEVMARSTSAFLEYSEYVKELIEERRREPQDDLMSILVGAKDDGLLTRFEASKVLEGSSEQHQDSATDELIMLLVVLMVAGNETTRNGISGGMQLLIENPEAKQKLVDNPALIPAAVEEMVRLVSPVQNFGRTLTQDYEYKGVKMQEGQKVLMVYPSANRDETVFEDADVFKVERNPHHLGFGIGSHFCLGANLARMEMRVAFEEILKRFPDMAYSRGGPEFRPSALVRSCMHMWVKYTPEA
jgi:cytochrome P450 family 142 subfamily A polypeptide 1